MNTNYQRGRRAEYEAKKLLEKRGYQVIRAAGSHGPFDLVAIRVGDPVLGLQIKATSSKTVARSLLRGFHEQAWGGFRSELWVRLAGKWYTTPDWHNTDLWD